MRSLAVLLLAFQAVIAHAQSTPDALRGFFQKLKSGEKQTVVAYGTSLTAAGAWVPLMKAWFEEKFPGQVTVVNSGGSGQHSDWGVAQLPAKVLEHRPNLVFIEFSYNDAHRRFQFTPQHCRKNLDTIIDGIQAADPTTAVVLQTMNAPWDPPEGKGFKDSETNRPELEAFNDNYRAAAKERGLPLVDNYPVWRQLKETNLPRYKALVPDGSHPSKAGSEAVTWPNVKALLEKASS